MPVRDLARAILRSVVDQNDFVVRIREAFERDQTLFERVGCVVRAHDYRRFRPGALRVARKRHVGERRGDGDGRRLQIPLAIDEAERPVDYRMAAAPPFIRPGERDGAARALFERRANVHRRDFRLPGFAFADAVGARLGQQERLVAGDVLQPREIRAQLRLAMQIERKVEELGRRKVDVREQRIRPGGLRVLVQVAQEALDADASVPADHAGWNLVAERDRENRRMIRQLANVVDDLAANRALQPAVVEKRDMLRPRKAHHHAQAVPPGLVEQFAARRRVEPDRVDAERRHQAKILGDLL